MAVITVGSEAIDRAGTQPIADFGPVSYTIIDYNNPADADGFITSVSVYVASKNGDVTGYVGIFYETGEHTFKCRAAASLGVLSLGMNTINELALTCKAGDYIGLHGVGSTLGDLYVDAANATGNSYAYYSGGVCVVDSETTFQSVAFTPSLQGTGESPQSSKSINLDMLLAGSGSANVALDIILSRPTTEHPYYIEVRDSSGNLLGVIKDLISGSLTQEDNLPETLSFAIPAGELRASLITRTNLLYVVDAATDTAIAICTVQIDEAED